MLPFPMARRIPPLPSPPVVPFRSFPPANLLRACPSGRRAFVPLRQPNLSPLCFHTLTNPFFRNPFLFTSMQNPRGCGVEILGTELLFSVPSVPPRQIHSFQAFAASLPSFSTSRPLFSSTCSLFSQTPGWGVVHPCIGALCIADSHDHEASLDPGLAALHRMRSGSSRAAGRSSASRPERLS